MSNGDRQAANEFIPQVYDELRHIARLRRANIGNWQSPGTTSLVHELYVNLADQHRLNITDRMQFLYLASVAIRNLVVDHARYSSRKKRAGATEPLDDPAGPDVNTEQVLAIDETLNRLATEDTKLCQIVECRFFGGLTVDETAEALGISPATVKRGWDTARAWLYTQLRSDV